MVGAIIFTVSQVISAVNTITGIIADITTIKQNIAQIQENIQMIWGSTSNADSNMFDQRMQELFSDINDMLDCLNEYQQLLERTAREYERTQQDVYNNANNLKSPRNF